MAETAASSMDRIRSLIDDRNQGNYTIRGPRMLAMLSAWVQETLNEISTGEDIRTAAVTLLLNTRDYLLGGTNPMFTGINAAIYNNTGVSPTSQIPLKKVSVEEIQLMWQQNPQGDPVGYATYEKSDGTVRFIIDRNPTATQVGRTIDVWTNDGRNGLTAPTDTLVMQMTLLSAIEHKVASECIMGMTAEDLAKRGIAPGQFAQPPQLAQQYAAFYERALQKERDRIASIRRAAGVILRNV